METKRTSKPIIHWKVRAPMEPGKILFTCPDCNLKKYAFYRTIKHRKWRGLCSDCLRKRGHPLKLTHDEIHSSGSIIHWSDREPGSLQRVAVTCHGCGSTNFHWRSNFKTATWQGLCPDCARQRGNPRRLTGDKKHISGSTIHWDDRPSENPDRVAVTCHRCKQRSYVEDGTVFRSSWLGLCQGCSPHAWSNNINKFNHDQSHPTGAIVHWSDRALGARRDKVAFSCCAFKERDYAWSFEFGREKWRGLCGKCRCAHGDPRKFSQNEVLEEWGSTIHWGEENRNRVAVTCGLCGHKRLMSRFLLIGHRSEMLAWLKVAPELDRLRPDPRFASLMRRVGFAP